MQLATLKIGVEGHQGVETRTKLIISLVGNSEHSSNNFSNTLSTIFKNYSGTSGHGDGEHEDSGSSSSRVLRRQADSAGARAPGQDRPGEFRTLQATHRHHERETSQKVPHNSAQIQMHQDQINNFYKT